MIMEFILFISIIINILLGFIVYKQNYLLRQYELFFKEFAEKIKDFTIFLNSILKMNILYFDDTIFELVDKVKQMKNDLLIMIQNNKVLFDEIDMTEIEQDEDLEHDEEEKEILGTVKKYGGTRITKQ